MRCAQPENAKFPIDVTLDGRVYWARVLPMGYWISVFFCLSKRTPAWDENLELSLSTSMVPRDVQPSNTAVYILLMFLGMTIEVRDTQPENAVSPMYVALALIVTDRSEVQP